MKLDKDYVTHPGKIWSWSCSNWSICAQDICVNVKFPCHACAEMESEKFLLSFISKASTKCSFFRCRKVKQFIFASLIFSPKCHINVKIVRHVFRCTMSKVILLFLFSKVIKLYEAILCKTIICMKLDNVQLCEAQI